MRIVPILAGLALGLAAGYLAMPAIYRAVPSDLTATQRAVATLREQPSFVILGDSRGMADVDAGLLGAANLSAPDQSLASMVLLADALPRTTRLLVVVPPEDDGRPIPAIEENALWMSGLRPSARARSAVARCTGSEPFTRSELAQRFAARWVLRQALESAVRGRMRPRGSMYATRVSDEQFAAEVAIAKTYRPRVTPAVRCLLDALARPGVSFVVPPIHSAAATPAYVRYARDAGITDFARAMPDDAFADARHLTPAGARAFTLRLR